jgi:hypothetical protein
MRTTSRERPSNAEIARARRELRQLARRLTDCGQPMLAVSAERIADRLAGATGAES